MPVRVRLAAVGALGALVLLLAGCGGGGGGLPVRSTDHTGGASVPEGAASADSGASASASDSSSNSDQSGNVLAVYVATVPQGKFIQFAPGGVPTPQPTNGMYDFAYDGGRNFSTNEVAGMRDITGSPWHTCQDWSSDHNATGQSSLTNVPTGDEICYSTSTYLVDIIVTGYGASSATVHVTIGRG